MTEAMWNKIITVEAYNHMKEIESKEVDEILHVNKSRIKKKNKADKVKYIDDSINKFINHLKNTVDYRTIVICATKWDTYDELRQTNIAIEIAGMYMASYFMILLDYLSVQYKEGKLK